MGCVRLNIAKRRENGPQPLTPATIRRPVRGEIAENRGFDHQGPNIGG